MRGFVVSGARKGAAGPRLVLWLLFTIVQDGPVLVIELPIADLFPIRIRAMRRELPVRVIVAPLALLDPVDEGSFRRENAIDVIRLEATVANPSGSVLR